jgi:hypothetical protein|tara:strand:- start:226 stop:351 length:126 start_codon:yes stop_codon:yes gene_type:complete
VVDLVKQAKPTQVLEQAEVAAGLARKAAMLKVAVLAMVENL